MLTTKVVLTGGGALDQVLQEETASRWRISPFEFCSFKEFDSLRTSGQYYFLLVASLKGVRYLTLVKGGPSESIADLYEVVSLPLCSAFASSGRELAYLGALLDIIQDFTEKAMSSGLKGNTGLTLYSRNLGKLATKQVYLASGDLSPRSAAARGKYFDSDLLEVDDDRADDIFIADTYNAVVSYTVHPTDPCKGDWEFRLLIDALTHELYYFRRVRITQPENCGFDLRDIRRIAAGRKKKMR